MLVLITLGAALAVGYARGGRLRRLLDVRPRRGRLLLTALVIAVVGVLAGWIWPATTTLLWSLTLVTVAWFCWLNRAVQGAGLVAIGLMVNAVAGLERLMDDPPGVLTILGDVIPVVVPWTAERVSPGDVLVAAGLAAILATSMIPPVRASAVVPGPVAGASVPDERLDSDQPKEQTDGQESTQAQGPEEEQREPRQASQQLTRHLA